METRRHPHMVACRTTKAEKALVTAAAAELGLTMNDFVRGVVLPAARRELLVGDLGESGVGSTSSTMERGQG